MIVYETAIQKRVNHKFIRIFSILDTCKTSKTITKASTEPVVHGFWQAHKVYEGNIIVVSFNPVEWCSVKEGEIVSVISFIYIIKCV